MYYRPLLLRPLRLLSFFVGRPAEILLDAARCCPPFSLSANVEDRYRRVVREVYLENIFLFGFSAGAAPVQDPAGERPEQRFDPDHLMRGLLKLGNPSRPGFINVVYVGDTIPGRGDVDVGCIYLVA